MSILIKRVNKKYYIIPAVIIAFIFSLWILLGYCLNTFLSKEFIQNYFKAQTGLSLLVEKPDIKTYPNLTLRVKSDEFAIFIKDPNKPTLYFKQGDVSIKILPLLFKRLCVKNISADDMKISATRDINGVFDFEKFKKNNLELEIFLKFDKTKMALSNLNVDIKDEKQSKRLIVSSHHFDVFEYSENKSVDFDILADVSLIDLKTKKEEKVQIDAESKIKLPLIDNLNYAKFKSDVEIKNVNLKPFMPYAKEFSKLDIKNMTGVFDLFIKNEKTNEHNLIDLSVLSKDVNMAFNLDGKINTIHMSASSSFDLKLDATNEDIKIVDSNLILNKSNLKIVGDINNYKRKVPSIDLKLFVKNSNVLDFANIVPAGLVKYKTDIVNELKKSQIKGALNVELSAKGKLNEPNLLGEATLEDAFLYSRPRFKTASAKCEFQGDKIFVDVLVPASKSENLKVVGTSGLYEPKEGNYSIVSSDNLDLNFAHKYLIPIQRIIGFNVGPLAQMKISGNGKIDLKTKGTLAKSSANGYFKTQNATASLNGINAVIKDAKVELEFKDTQVIIKKAIANAYGSNLVVTGYVDSLGILDMKAGVKDISAATSMNILKTSPLLKDVLPDLSFITKSTGVVDFTINAYDDDANFKDPTYIKTVVPFGDVILKSNAVGLYGGAELTNTRGKITYGKDFAIALNALLDGSKVELDANMKKNNKAQYVLNSNVSATALKFKSVYNFVVNSSLYKKNNIDYIVSSSPLKDVDFLLNSKLNLKGNLPVGAKELDLGKIIVNGQIKPYNSDKNKNIKFNTGDYNILNTNLHVVNSKISLLGADVFCEGVIKKILTKPNFNTTLKADDLTVSGLDKLVKNLKIAPIKKALDSFIDYKGSVDVDLNTKNNITNGAINFSEISARNAKKDLSLTIRQGALSFKNNVILTDALNLNYGNTPMYLNAEFDLRKSNDPRVKANFTTNLSQQACDTIINPYLTYPIKIKEEVILKGIFDGGISDYTIGSKIILPKGSDVTYMGANFDDTTLDRQLSAKINVSKNIIKIANAKYIKYITSQNGNSTPITMLDVSGGLLSKNKKVLFNNFKILTPNAMSAKLFNILFKKSILKQGVFTCDLILNGDMLMPSVVGSASLNGLNMPLYSTKVSDMYLKLNKNEILADIKGKSFESLVEIRANVKNDFTFPIVLNDLNINYEKAVYNGVLNQVSHIPTSGSQIVADKPIVFNPKDLIIKQGSANIKELQLYGIKANDVVVKFSNTTGKVFNLDALDLNIAGGTMNTVGNFNFDTLEFNSKSEIKNCDAQTLVKGFIGLENQISGNTNAQVNLSGKMPTKANEIKSVMGNVSFVVNNGKMSKLGSLEYLLRAGNLVRSGIFGLTLNNIIQVLSPYKTGEFSKIQGDFSVQDGKMSNLEVYSSGENLSIFISGDYDIMADNANIEVLGRLSKNVSNVLGPVGNTSLNSLVNILSGNKLSENSKSEIFDNVNKIPLIGLSSPEFRLFIVKVNGSLNSDKSVKSFDWLN